MLVELVADKLSDVSYIFSDTGYDSDSDTEYSCYQMTKQKCTSIIRLYESDSSDDDNNDVIHCYVMTRARILMTCHICFLER